MNKEEIIKSLIKKGGEIVNNLVVDSVTVNLAGSIERSYVNFKTKSKVKAVVDGKTVEVDFFNVSLISVLGALKPVVGSGVYHHCKDVPTALEDLLQDATIDIVQLLVKKDESYVNPFSSTPNPVIATEDKYYNNLAEVSLGKEGKDLMRTIKLVRNFGAGFIGKI